MEIEKLKNGDTVRLRSGGCDMVISAIGSQDGETFIKCDWHDANFQPHSATYYPYMVKKVPECRK